MMIEPVDECIYEINDILSLLIKGDKWEGMANRLTKFLTLTWNKEQKEAIREAIRFFVSVNDDNYTSEEIDIVLLDLEDKLGERIAEVFRKDVQKIQLESYTKGHTDAGIQFELNAPDKKALRWLFEKDVKQFWIGESYTEDLNKKLNEVGAKIIQSGLSRSDAAELLKKSLGDEFKKTNHYWEMLAEHIVTRAREFGRTSAYEKAGIDYIKIVAIMDHRTSAICRFLNGKIISVKKAIEQRNKLMTAKTVDEVKKIAPWYTDKQVAAFEGENKLPKGIGLPPYHAFCRTTTVIAYPDEIETAS
jgi:SPP1 gp7 family putative phage head morphogenesis protein